MILSYNMA